MRQRTKNFPRNLSIFSAALVGSMAILTASSALACPFCSAVSQTLRQEIEMMDAVVIAEAIPGEERDADTGQVKLKVTRVLKGKEHAKPGETVVAVYYGNVTEGRKFMLSGVDPPELQWSCMPVNDRSEKYLAQVVVLPDDDLARLRFYQDFLEDKDSMLARDAYDEFAIAPYDAVRALKDEMDHEQLVEWIREPEMPADRKRLYLTMLGVCGSDADLPMLESMLRSDQKSSRSGLDALIACYLTLSGEDGLKLIDELFLVNKKSPYADTYAAIMAIRFHGTEGETIARSALLPSLHAVLERTDLADLVIPDLARWGDWSQIDRLVQLFTEADKDNNWVRVPVVNYLRACPLPEADAALAKLKEIDPDSVRRANTFFAAPVQPSEPGPNSSSSLPADADEASSLVGLPLPAGPLAENRALSGPVDKLWKNLPEAPAAAANPVNLSGVLGVAVMAAASLMITAWLILTGGAPAQD